MALTVARDSGSSVLDDVALSRRNSGTWAEPEFSSARPVASQCECSGEAH
jgi:hypothetical protein